MYIYLLHHFFHFLLNFIKLEQVVKLEILKMLKKVEFLLNNEIYISVICIIKKNNIYFKHLDIMKKLFKI